MFFYLIMIYSNFLVVQKSIPETIFAHFTMQKIQLHGVLNKPAWDYAIHMSNLTQRELNVGEEVICNFRMHLIPKIEVDFFIIIIQTFDTYRSKWKLALNHCSNKTNMAFCNLILNSITKK